MSELSLPWTTDAATPEGDQQASYTQAQLAIMHKIIAACSGFEGVAPGFLNELACTGAGANTVAVATGGAVVDGIAYQNDASQNVNIPSAVGGGNTRIDRIVLRADWAGFNVSVHRIAGTDAGSPTAPAITQNSGTTYDIQLCRVLVDTAGAVTVTDERVFAQHIRNDIVDDTKVGDRVPQFYRRQGGNATNWASPGSTNYTPGAVRMQAGVAQVALELSELYETAIVAFPVAFSQPPIVTLGLDYVSGTIGDAIIYTTNLSNAGVTLRVARSTTGPALAMNIHWLAIGPE